MTRTLIKISQDLDNCYCVFTSINAILEYRCNRIEESRSTAAIKSFRTGKKKNMLGSLTSTQIESVLRSQMTGRIGCYADDEIYIVPITYVYDDGFIYAHSKEGRKVQMLRKNPKVCFQVDAMQNMTNWRSVIVWGQYEELKSQDEQKRAMQILADRLAPFTTSATVRTSDSAEFPKVVEKRRKPVFYRIRVEKSTGRFEKTIL